MDGPPVRSSRYRCFRHHQILTPARNPPSGCIQYSAVNFRSADSPAYHQTSRPSCNFQVTDFRSSDTRRFHVGNFGRPDRAPVRRFRHSGPVVRARARASSPWCRPKIGVMIEGACHRFSLLLAVASHARLHGGANAAGQSLRKPQAQ